MHRARLLALCGAAALASGAGACSRPATGGLEVRAARAVVTDTAGAVYFTVVNPGSRSDRLVRVETAAAGAAETHESVEENGLVRMVARPEGFTIPAGGTLELKPGGKHVMLMGLRAPGSLGDALSVTLRFARAGAITTRAKIVRPGEAMAGGEAH